LRLKKVSFWKQLSFLKVRKREFTKITFLNCKFVELINCLKWRDWLKINGAQNKLLSLELKGKKKDSFLGKTFFIKFSNIQFTKQRTKLFPATLLHNPFNQMKEFLRLINSNLKSDFKNSSKRLISSFTTRLNKFFPLTINTSC